MEKWSSRCGWDGEEWDGWYQNALHHRRAEQEFWEKAQERVVKEKTSAKKADKSANDTVAVEVTLGGATKEMGSGAESPVKEKRKSIFKRMFRRSETTGAVAVAVAVAAA